MRGPYKAFYYLSTFCKSQIIFCLLLTTVGSRFWAIFKPLKISQWIMCVVKLGGAMGPLAPPSPLPPHTIVSLVEVEGSPNL
jgi:hypothetical protein